MLRDDMTKMLNEMPADLRAGVRKLIEVYDALCLFEADGADVSDLLSLLQQGMVETTGIDPEMIYAGSL